MYFHEFFHTFCFQISFSITVARERLVALGNGALLEEIDSAIVTLCLDDWEHNEECPERAVAELCCGSDPRNRWFDKSVSMIFSNNGLLGINFEHAWGDGVAVMRLCNEVIAITISFFFLFKYPQNVCYFLGHRRQLAKQF